jgi:hypothetical protein
MLKRHFNIAFPRLVADALPHLRNYVIDVGGIKCRMAHTVSDVYNNRLRNKENISHAITTGR